MRMSRLVPVVAAGALVAATVGPASAAEPGVGTTTATLEAVGLDVGELLSLSLLTDTGLADTNPADGVSKAAADLTALEVVSDTLGLDEQISVLSVESTGDEETASAPETALPDNPIIGGTVLPAALSALVGADGAVSTIGAGVTDLTVLDGIVSLSSTELDLGANALAAQADGARALTLDSLTLLDLEALLAGLGIPLSSLSVEQILGLVDSLAMLGDLADTLTALGIPVDTTTVDGIVATLGELEALPALAADTGTLDTACADATLGSTLDTLGGLTGDENVCDDTAATIGDITDVLTTGELASLQELVDTLLGDALDAILAALDGVSLVSLDLLQVGATTTATDSVETSVADIAATIEGLRVGGLLDIPVADVLGATDAVVGQVNGALDGVLGEVGLEGLVTITLLEEVTSVTEKDGAIISDAAFTGLGVEVTPDLALLEELTGGLLDPEDAVLSIGEQIQLLDEAAELPVSPLSLLNEDLGGLVLGDGVSIRTASLGQNSTHVLSATATPTAPAAPAAPELPMTGSNDTLWLFVAAVAAAGALGIRRMTVRTDS